MNSLLKKNVTLSKETTMALQDIPKKKTRPLDPKFNVEIKPARKKKAVVKRALEAVGKPEIKIKDAMAKPKAGMTLKEFEKSVRAKPKTTKPEKYEDTRAAKAKADKAKAKIMKDFGKK
jgi:hypothetical protein